MSTKSVSGPNGPPCTSLVTKGFLFLPVRLVDGKRLPAGVVKDRVVGEQVEHPRREGVEAVEPPAKVVEEADTHLDRGVLRSIFLEPPGIFKPLTTG